MVEVGTKMNIGEFAEQTGLSISAVRFYGKRGLLIPAEVNASNGYRYYHSDQLADGLLVADLRRMDMPLALIAEALRLDPEARRAIVAEHVRHLEDVLKRARTVANELVLQERAPLLSDPGSGCQETAMSMTTIKSRDLVCALDQVLPAAGIDPERPNLMCVLIEGRDGSVRFVATDSHRLAVRDLVPIALNHEFTATVAAATLHTWRADLAGCQDAAISLDIDGRLVAATEGGLDLEARIVPITFPDYEPVLRGSENVADVQVDRGRLLAALERFDDSGAVLFTASGGSLRLQRRELSQDLDAIRGGGDASVAIDPAFAADAVRHAIGNEVVIEIDGPADPVAFRSADDGTYSSLLMPVLLDGEKSTGPQPS